MNLNKRALFICGYFLLFTAVLIFTALFFLRHKSTYNPPATVVASAVKPNKPLSTFNLLATNGTHFSEKSLRGHWTLLFFGYPACPDICPKTLGLVRDTWNIFSADNQPIPARFVFTDISSQPVAIDQLKTFLHNYRDDFLGLSGQQDQIHALGDQLGIYAQQMPDKLDHTAALMLIDPQGRLSAVITPPFSAQDLAHDLQVLINRSRNRAG